MRQCCVRHTPHSRNTFQINLIENDYDWMSFIRGVCVFFLPLSHRVNYLILMSMAKILCYAICVHTPHLQPWDNIRVMLPTFHYINIYGHFKCRVHYLLWVILCCGKAAMRQRQWCDVAQQRQQEILFQVGAVLKSAHKNRLNIIIIMVGDVDATSSSSVVVSARKCTLHKIKLFSCWAIVYSVNIHIDSRLDNVRCSVDNKVKKKMKRKVLNF